MKNTNTKNYYPLAIIALLGFGVVMIIISISIALKNPIQDEYAYFEKKRLVDENINQIIHLHNAFINDFNPQITLLDSQGNAIDNVTFSTPYLRKASGRKKTKAIITPPITLEVKLNSTDSIDSINAYIDSFSQSNVQNHIGSLVNNGRIYSLALDSLPLGRWNLILEITLTNKGRIFFEGEIYID